MTAPADAGAPSQKGRGWEMPAPPSWVAALPGPLLPRWIGWLAGTRLGTRRRRRRRLPWLARGTRFLRIAFVGLRAHLLFSLWAFQTTPGRRVPSVPRLVQTPRHEIPASRRRCAATGATSYLRLFIRSCYPRFRCPAARHSVGRRPASSSTHQVTVAPRAPPRAPPREATRYRPRGSTRCWLRYRPWLPWPCPPSRRCPSRRS